MITRLDTEVGHILSLLTELHIDENTIVFFVSDNGLSSKGYFRGGKGPNLTTFFQNASPCRGQKGDLHAGGLLVPALARWPARITAGSVSDQPWAFWDFLPTAAELAGADAPEGSDGISIVPTLLNRPAEQQHHEYFYWEYRGTSRAARFDNYWAIQKNGQAIELYNIKRDPKQQNDLAKLHPELIVTALYEFVRSDAYPLKRVLELANIASRGDAESTPELVKHLRDENAIMRFWAIMGLRIRGDACRGVLPHNEKTLDDSDASVRVTAMALLGELSDRGRAARLLLAEAKQAETHAHGLWALDGLKYLDVPEVIQEAAKQEVVNKGEYCGRIHDFLRKGGKVGTGFPQHAPLQIRLQDLNVSSKQIQDGPMAVFDVPARELCNGTKRFTAATGLLEKSEAERMRR